jgi:hypothetical protein
MKTPFPTVALGYISKTKTVNLVIALQERQTKLQPRETKLTTMTIDAMDKNELKTTAKAVNTL